MDPTSQTWRGHREIIPTQDVCSAFGYPAAFSNASGSKLSDVENDAKFWRRLTHFLSPVKIMGGVGEICILIVEALPTIEPPKYI